MTVSKADRDKIINRFMDMVRVRIKGHISQLRGVCTTKEDFEIAIEVYKDVVRREWGYLAVQVLEEERIHYEEGLL